MNTVGRFRRMRDPQAEVVVDETGWSFTSELGEGRLAWPALTEVWRRRGYWMLFTGPAQFNTVPDATVPERVRAALARLACGGD